MVSLVGSLPARSVPAQGRHARSPARATFDRAGIELTREQDAAKAADLDARLDRLAESMQALPMDSAAFRAWAQRMHRRSDTLYEDAMIAATTQVHRLTVVTRDVADFKALGVAVLDPFATPRR